MSTAPASRPSPPRWLSEGRGLYGIAGPHGPGPAAERRAETVRVAQALLAAGVPVVQLRDKHADGRELLASARELRTLTRAAGARLVVNDRLDVALLAGADGVHLGQDDLPLADCARLLAELGRRGEGEARFVVGISTHDEAQIREAVAAGADYLGFGPVYATTTREAPWPVVGTAGLAQAVRLAAPLPVVAIGGITLERAGEVARTGVAFAAVIADVASAPDPVARAAALHRTLSGGALAP